MGSRWRLYAAVLLCCVHASLCWTRGNQLPIARSVRFSKLSRPTTLTTGAATATTATTRVRAAAGKGLLTEVPEPLKEVSQAMCDAVRQAKLLPDPPFFRINGDSPLARKVNELRIPLHPQSNAATVMPYLQMHGLADRNMTSFVSIADKAAVRLHAGKKMTVLLGCFGAGKSRLAMEMMAEEFGIYLPMSDKHGWDDLPALFAAFDKEGSKQATEANTLLLNELVESLLLSRLMVLDALLKEYPSLTPAQWIWVQRHPGSIFESPAPLKVTLKAAWRLCREAPWAARTGRSDAINALAKALQLHMKSKEDLLCVVDDPELLLDLFDERFPSKNASRPQAMYAPMVSQIAGFTDLVVCGSSSRLLTELMTHRPPDRKAGGVNDNDDAQQFHVVPRWVSLTPEDCREFVRRFLDTSDLTSIQLDEIAELLAGRPLFVERLVSATLFRAASAPSSATNKNSSPGKLPELYATFQQLIADQTTPMVQVTNMPVYLLNTIHGAISRATGLSAYKSSISRPLLMQFKTAALKLWDTGEPQSLPYHVAAALVDEGLANVVSTERGPEVFMNELVVALAAKNFWESSKSGAGAGATITSGSMPAQA